MIVSVRPPPAAASSPVVSLDSWSGVRPARLSEPTISQLVPAVPAIRPG
ncbi:MAG: hypothetical protein WBV74_12850 [Pseudonocardiaceae bacterium]